MNDSKEQPLASSTIHPDSDHPGEPLQPTISVTQRKRRHFASLIVLVLLGAIVVVYLLHSAFAAKYEGLGIALCVVACGVFLVRHAIRLMKAEDKMQDPQPDGNEAAISPPDPNPAGQETNRGISSSEAGQNTK